MDLPLSAVQWSFPLVHINEIFEFRSSSAEQIDHVHLVLPTIENPAVPLMLKKYNFVPQKTDYLALLFTLGA